LDNTNDPLFRCASCDWPTFGFAQNLGAVSQIPQSVRYVVGNVREENVNWLGTSQKALWLEYWPTLGELVDFFFTDHDSALMRADALDMKLLNDAFTSGGQFYADIITFSLRQSYAGNEFSGAVFNSNSLFFLLSSGTILYENGLSVCPSQL
jgi:hypothetical protein